MRSTKTIQCQGSGCTQDITGQKKEKKRLLNRNTKPRRLPFPSWRRRPRPQTSALVSPPPPPKDRGGGGGGRDGPGLPPATAARLPPSHQPSPVFKPSSLSLANHEPIQPLLIHIQSFTCTCSQTPPRTAI